MEIPRIRCNRVDFLCPLPEAAGHSARAVHTGFPFPLDINAFLSSLNRPVSASLHEVCSQGKFNT